MPDTKRWSADSYPSTGLYEVNGRVIAVYCTAANIAPGVMDIGSVDSYPLASPANSATPTAVAAPAPSGLSEALFLKALAIAQQPELATKLL